MGFMPGVSSEFQALSLRVVIADARRARGNLVAIFVDVRNAFGSISHDAIQRALRLFHAPPPFCATIGDLYTGVSFYFRGISWEGTKDELLVPLERGVRQGCPLSPILYIVAFDPVLRWLERSGLGYRFAAEPSLRVAQLGFADDVVLLAESMEAASRSTAMLCKFGHYAGTGLNPDKCAALVIARGEEHPDEAVLTQDGLIPGVKRGGGYHYLGFEVRVDLAAADAESWSLARSKFSERLAALDASSLPPIARLDTLRSWALPVLGHALKLAVVPEKELSMLDAVVSKHVISWLTPETRATFPPGAGRPASAPPQRRVGGNRLPGIPRLNVFEPQAFGGLGVQSATTTSVAAKLSLLSRALCRPVAGATEQWALFHRIVVRSLEDEPAMAEMLSLPLVGGAPVPMEPL